MLRLGLRVARQHEFTPVGGWDAHVYHLHRLEFGDHLTRREAAGQGPEVGLERDLQAISEEGYEDVRLDAIFAVVEDRAHRQVVLEFLEQLGDILPVNISRVRS